MEFHLNDFIKPIREDSVFVGKLFQIIEFQEKRDFGKPARLVKIRNVETKADLKIDENQLFQHFQKIDFKSVPIETADTEWKLDELRDRNEESKSELKIPEDAMEQIALIRKLIKEKCPTVSVRCGKGTGWGWVDICLDSKWLEDIHIEFLKILVSHEIDHIQLYRMLYWKSKKLCERFQKALDEEFEKAFLKTFGREKI